MISPPGASYEVKEGDRISLRFGARITTVEVLSVQETVRQSEAAAPLPPDLMDSNSLPVCIHCGQGGIDP